MAGGIWKQQDKVLAGVYVNTVSESRPMGSLGASGIVAFPAALPWGNPGIIKFTSDEFFSDALKLLGFRPTDARISNIASAAEEAQEIILYRIGGTGATPATALVAPLTITAKYGGLRGNDLKVVIQESLDVEDAFDVYTLIDNQQVDLQTAKVVADLTPNDFVTFTGTGDLVATSGASLAGGTAGTATGDEYADAFAAFEAEDFNVLGIPVIDTPTKQLATAYTKRLREAGKKFTTMVIGYPEADYEGVTSLKNGVLSDDGTIIPATTLIWKVAAMEAAARVNESLTYAVIPNAVDASPKYTVADTIKAVNAGEMVISLVKGRVVIEQDINTLTTFTLEKRKEFRKNRVLRVLDAIDNDLQRIFGEFYIGKVSNNTAGRNLFKNEAINYLKNLQEIEAIQNFDQQTDIIVRPGTDSDAVLIDLYIQPVDSVEKIYITVTVR